MAEVEGIELTMPAFTDEDQKRFEDPAEMERIRTDPVYFINTCCWTFDPRKDNPPHEKKFVLYGFQEVYVTDMVNAIRAGKDVLTEKSRDMGVSWTTLAVLLWMWLFEPGFQCLIGSRKEELVDNGTLDSLYGKIMFMFDRLPFTVDGFNKRTHKTHMKLENPGNGNMIKGESANAEFSRQGRYTVAFFDEFGFWESPQTAWEAAGESTPCRFAVTTPPKIPNFVSALRESGKCMVLTLHWKLHPLKDEAWYQRACLNKFPDEVARELDINWQGALTGIVYPEIARVRVGKFGYMPQWPLFVAHDFGHHPDPHAVLWFQVNPVSGRIRLLESFERNGKIITWFLPFFGHPISSEFSYTEEDLRTIRKVGAWRSGTHYGDPAGRQRNEVSGTSVIHVLNEYGIYVQTNTKANDLESRKMEMRKVLIRLDVNDTPNNRIWMKAIKNARYPQRSEASQPTTENIKPVHDWTSHMRTATEYFAVNLDYMRTEEEPTGLTFNKALATIKRKHTSQQFIGNESA